MCPKCRCFGQTHRIGSPDEFQLLHTAILCDGLQPGTLRIVDGDLQWADLIHCELRCTACGQAFVLDCETYHGGGGEWKVI
jgi:hypothetical protein